MLGLEALAKLHRRSLGASSHAAKQGAGGLARGRAEADAFCTAAGLMQSSSLPATRCLYLQSICQDHFKAADGAGGFGRLCAGPPSWQAAV